MKHYNSENFVVNDTCISDNDTTELKSNQYTNVLKAVHENIDDYIGKKITFVGYIYRINYLQANQFVLARNMIINQANQTVVVGFLSEYDNINNFANYSEPTTMVPPVSDMPKVDGPIMTHEVNEVPLQTVPLDSMIKVVEEPDTVVASSAVSENVNVVSNEVPPVAPNFSSTPIMETPAMNMVDVQPINNPSQTPIVEPPVVEPISPVADVVTPVDVQPINPVLENKSDEQIVIPVEEPLVQQPVTSMPTAQNATDMVGNLNGVSGSNIVIPNEQQVVDSQVESNTIVYPQEQNINTADNFEDDIWKL